MEGWLYDDAPNGLYHFILLTLVLGRKPGPADRALEEGDQALRRDAS